MNDAQKPHPLLQKPLFIYSLPEELLNTLTLKGDAHSFIDDVPDRTTEPKQEYTEQGTIGCVACNIASFTSLSQQRDHVRGDLHKFNLKRKVAGQKAVNADEFDKMLDDLNESISGSESVDSVATSSSEDPLSKLLAKHNITSSIATSVKAAKSRSPLIWFTSPILPQPTYLGIYRAMFNDEDLQEDPIALLRYQQIPLPPSKAPRRTIALMMIGGGHFAAIIASLALKVVKNHQGQEERQIDVIASKSFHRYTTRRKQGGSQSTNDAAKGNAHSAGSSLRRHNEAALQKEVRELLASWREELAEADLIFIRASGSANRRTLFGYEGAVLKSNDSRIRGFPFTTRRATKTELLRCYNELTRVKVSHIDEVALASKAKQTPTSVATTTKPQVTEEDKEEQRLVTHSLALTPIIQRKKIPALTAYLKDNNLSPDFALHPISTHSHTSTLLHLASASSLPSIVATLLKLGANPELTNAAGKTPYEIAGDRATRDRFRVSRHILGESKWNWDDAKVGKPLTEKDAQLRDQREKVELAEAKAQKAAESKRIADEAIKPNNATSGSGSVPRGLKGISTERGNSLNDRGITEEMRLKIERERRARAAEARFSAMPKKA